MQNRLFAALKVTAPFLLHTEAARVGAGGGGRREGEMGGGETDRQTDRDIDIQT